MNEYLQTETDNLVDSDLIGFIICDVMEAYFPGLMPLINKLYDAGYVSDDIPGTKEEVNKDFKKIELNKWKYPILSIYEQYDEIVNKWYSFDEEEVDEDEMHMESLMVNTPDTSNFQGTTKVGRNDPCPCGSGKKYKKCCWNKNMN